MWGASYAPQTMLREQCLPATGRIVWTVCFQCFIVFGFLHSNRDLVFSSIPILQSSGIIYWLYKMIDRRPDLEVIDVSQNGVRLRSSFIFPRIINWRSKNIVYRLCLNFKFRSTLGLLMLFIISKTLNFWTLFFLETWCAIHWLILYYVFQTWNKYKNVNINYVFNRVQTHACFISIKNKYIRAYVYLYICSLRDIVENTYLPFE